MGTMRLASAASLLVLVTGSAPTGEAFRRLVASGIRMRLLGKVVADKLAKGLRVALDQVKIAKG